MRRAGVGGSRAGAAAFVAPFEPNLLEEGILLHVAQRIEPGPDRGVTAIDVIERAGTARAFVRDAEGALNDAPRFRDRLSTKHNRRPLGFPGSDFSNPRV